MNHHINKRVVLNQDTEFKSLYKWCLQELDTEENKIGRDLIPWDWTLYFTATDLTLADSITIEPEYDPDENGSKMAVREKQIVRARLRPGDARREDCRDPTYSMFGTDRCISAFELIIETLEGEDVQERCTVYGSVSYTFDLDFRDETTDDSVVFHLYVRPDTFARYSSAVSAEHVDQAVLSVSRVSGFYSDWSPAISTSEIKVLTSHDEHTVEMPEGCEIVPPRTGKVGQVSLHLLRIAKLEIARPDTTDNPNWLEEDLLSEPQLGSATSAAQQLANDNARAVALLSSVRTAAWVIAALLLLMLIM